MRGDPITRALDIARNIIFQSNSGMYERQLSYLVTLADEKRFSGAADACGVSQHMLTSGIKSLENKLGVPILKSGVDFQGFTQEGERILSWARHALASSESAKSESADAQPAQNNSMRMGVIPMAMPIVPTLTRGLQVMQYKAKPILLMKTTEEILQQIKKSELDIGLSYFDGMDLEGLEAQPIYTERLILVGSNFSSFRHRKEISWQNAAKLPLCLLTREMMNRQIIDKAFSDAGVQPNIVIETDSIFALYSQLRNSEIFSVVPHSFFYLSEWRDEFLAMPITPEITNTIGLISLNQEPCAPKVAAMRAIAQKIDFQEMLDKFMAPKKPTPAPRK